MDYQKQMLDELGWKFKKIKYEQKQVTCRHDNCISTEDGFACRDCGKDFLKNKFTSHSSAYVERNYYNNKYYNYDMTDEKN